MNLEMKPNLISFSFQAETEATLEEGECQESEEDSAKLLIDSQEVKN
jgi:hypothetical protein